MNQSTRETMFSSATDEWATPQDFMDSLGVTFDLDLCATAENAKAPVFFTKEDDGLSRVWSGVCWMNPPYGRGIGKWVEKARYSARVFGATVFCLLPARTDTAWWHEHIYNQHSFQPYLGVSFKLLRGRLKFGGSKNAAPFPSVLVVFTPGCH